MNIQRYSRIVFGVLILTCGGYTFVNKEVGGIAVELCVIVWATGRILAEALEAFWATGKK